MMTVILEVKDVKFTPPSIGDETGFYYSVECLFVLTIDNKNSTCPACYSKADGIWEFAFHIIYELLQSIEMLDDHKEYLVEFGDSGNLIYLQLKDSTIILTFRDYEGHYTIEKQKIKFSSYVLAVYSFINDFLAKLMKRYPELKNQKIIKELICQNEQLKQLKTPDEIIAMLKKSSNPEAIKNKLERQSWTIEKYFNT